jgi:replication factor C small subunit
MTSIWTEKYRPKTFSEIEGQTDIVKRVEAFVKNKNMPHLLFAGPAGVGKTSLSIVAARELFGAGWRHNILELNASDERGIDIVRNQVKNFARTRAIGDVPFKIIYLDECDALTKEAQQALRRTMENYTQTCRFVLSCNFSSKIIDPIKSRCTLFKFKPLSKEEIFKIINRIAKEEKLSIAEKAKDALYEASEGDCRRVENILQGAAALSTKIDEAAVYSLASTARPKEVLQLLDFAVKGDFVKARDMLLKTMLNYGLSGLDIIKQIQKEVWELKVEDRLKINMVDVCGEAEFRMVEGSDEFIQLESLLAKFAILDKKA